MTPEERENATEGLRFDEGKSRVDLIPPDAMMALGHVYGEGAKKYADRNWEKGMKWSKVLGCLLRHVYRRMMGEVYDDETGCLHSAHIAWNAMALLTYDIRQLGENDLPEIEVKTPWMADNAATSFSTREPVDPPRAERVAPVAYQWPTRD